LHFFYCLEAIIAVGYRTDSERAIQFRQWATGVLSQFAKKRDQQKSISFFILNP